MRKRQANLQKLTFKPRGAATAIGSLPLMDADKAADLMLNYLGEMPAWPQLPKLSFKENMYAQYTEGFPSVQVDEITEQVRFDTEKIEELESFYQKFLDKDLEHFQITKSYAAGLHSFIEKVQRLPEKPLVLKGQVTGPISFGLTVKDQNDKAVLYNEQFADVIVKGLALKAAWQESLFKKIAPQSQTAIFFDEPYLVSFGSAFVSLNQEDVLTKLDECFSYVEGLSGIHVCGGTDWGLIMQTKVNIIQFDAYDYFESMTLYPEQLNNFLNQGGILAWGITPHTSKIEAETSSQLFDQLLEKIGKIVKLGIDEDKLLEQSIIAPSCGAGSLSEENGEKALKLTSEVSKLFRARYFS